MFRVIGSIAEGIEKKNFAWELLSVTPFTMHFQLYFENPEYISTDSGAGPDKIQIELNLEDIVHFRNANDTQQIETFANGTYSRAYLGRQFPADSLLSAEAVDDIGIAVYYTTSIVLASNLVLNSIIIGALNTLWTMINGLQIIVHLPVFDTQFPANANTLLTYLIEVANFELIPPSLLENVLGSFEETWPLNENFGAIGYETRLLIQNLGSVYFAFMAHLVLFVVLGILWLFLKLHNGERVRKLKEKLEGYLMWNSIMKMLIEASLEIALACFINMDYMYWD